MRHDRATPLGRSANPQGYDRLSHVPGAVKKRTVLGGFSYGLDQRDDYLDFRILHQRVQVVGHAKVGLVTAGDGVSESQAAVRRHVEKEVQESAAMKERADWTGSKVAWQ